MRSVVANTQDWLQTTDRGGLSTHFGFEHGEEYPKLYDNLKSETLEKLNSEEQNNFNKAENEDKGVVN